MARVAVQRPGEMISHSRILIIDDDDTFLETYKEILSAEGYDVQTAKTRAEALVRLDEPGWCVIIIDGCRNATEAVRMRELAKRGETARSPGMASCVRLAAHAHDHAA